ncbi:MAG: GNAT family N-acetyltransferase [Culicoidibacterales bacterium]
MMRFTTNELDTFSLFEDKALVGTIHFSIDPLQHIHIIEHVEISPGFEHQGFSELLMRTFVSQLHRKEVRISPACPFAKNYFEHHANNLIDWDYQKK